MTQLRQRTPVPATLDLERPPTTLRAATSKEPITAEERKDLLARARAGDDVRLHVDALVFLQKDEPNRNYTRFRPGMLRSFARSFVGMPFLRDHAQHQLLARGGTIVASKLVELGDGNVGIEQTLELVKPWAVEAALDGTMSTFSIGWHPTGEIECSVCKDDVRRDGWLCHWPGEAVELDDGAEATVEWTFTEAEGVEVSAVSVPAVKGTGVEGIRAALQAAALSARPSRPPKENRMLTLTNIAKALGCAEDEPAILAEIDRTKRELAAKTEQLTKADAAAAVAAKALHEREVAEIIDRAYADGKIIAARDEKGEVVEGDLEKYIRAMPTAAARDYVGRMPKMAPVGGELQSKGKDAKPRGGVALSDDGKKLARQLGLTDEDIKKHGGDAVEGAA